MHDRRALVLLGAALVGACARVPLSAEAPSSVGPRAPAAARAAFVVPDVAPVAARPPISLTAADGAGLEIASLTARTEVHGPLAKTELHLVFVNPEPRQREGRFRIAIPQRAFVSRLAMKIDGAFREADVAPLAVAREVYEETMHRRRDPLLVEQKDNELSARVFPIPASGVKEIIVGWTAAVGPAWPLTVPLRGLPRIGRLDVRVTGEGGTTLAHATTEGAAPTEDLRVLAADAGATAALANADGLVARVRVPGEATPEPMGPAVVVLFDTSASRAPELATQIALVRGTLARLAVDAPDLRAVVVAFDQESEVVHDGPAGAFGEGAARRLRARGALGASDLGAALDRAAIEARRVGARRALIVGDGVPTAGQGAVSSLRDAARALGAAGVLRLDAIAMGEVRSSATLRALALGALPSAGVVMDDADAAAVARRLVTRTLPALSVAVSGAAWSSPTSVLGAQPGDDVLVHAALRPGARGPRVYVAGEPVPLALGGARGAAADRTISASVAKARIDAIVERADLEGWDDAQRDAVVSLAQRHAVPSPLTAMLVVESDADRAALKDRIARARALPAPGSLAPVASPPPAPARAAPPAPAGAGAHVTRAPSLRMGATIVMGRVPPEVIQRIVRVNFGRFRACYEDGLRRDPKLRGRVTTKFVIQQGGDVASSVDGGSELPDPKVVRCVNAAFRDLQFPSPEHGSVTVVYPIVFAPAGDDGAEEQEASLRAPQRAYYRPRFGAQTWVAPPPPPPVEPWRGTYGEVARALLARDPASALARAARAHAEDARDPLALVALGEAAAAASLPGLAARAFGSLADLEPDRADVLRAAAVRLDALGRDALAIELLWRARDDRPDQPSSHHLLAVALLRAGRHAEAVDVLSRAVGRSYASRYGDVARLLRHDLSLAAAAWRAAEPAQAEAITRRAALAGAEPEERPSAWSAVTWESDASRVVVALAGTDAAGDDAWAPAVTATDGFGPEAIFALSPVAASLAPVVRYARRGPTGDALGVVHVMEHDGRGHVTVHPRPFVLMNEGGSVTLPSVSLGGALEAPALSPSSGSR